MKVVMIQSKVEGIGWEIVDEVIFTSDRTSKDNKNDVSIISEATFMVAKKSLEKGFCHDRFQPNIVISMSEKEEDQMKANTELDIENVKLFVLNKPHHCHKNCPLFIKDGSSCRWTSHIFYASVKTSGRVKRGDPVFIKIP